MPESFATILFSGHGIVYRQVEVKPITEFVIGFFHIYVSMLFFLYPPFRLVSDDFREREVNALQTHALFFACRCVYLCIYLLQCKHQSIYQITIYSATTKSRRRQKIAHM